MGVTVPWRLPAEAAEEAGGAGRAAQGGGPAATEGGVWPHCGHLTLGALHELAAGDGGKPAVGAAWEGLCLPVRPLRGHHGGQPVCQHHA